MIFLVFFVGPANAELKVDQRADGNVVVDGTLEAVPGYPRVHVQLRKDKKPLTAEPQLLGGRLSGMKGLQTMLRRQLNQQPGQHPNGPEAQKRDRWFTAFLDTGASAYVISKSTAQRFGIEALPKALYHEAGLQGSVPMHVSKRYTLALAGSGGPGQAGAKAFRVVSRDARLQLVPEAPDSALVRMAMGSINVIGTPAIRQLVVELTPSSGAGLGGASQLLRELQGGGQGRGGNDQAGKARSEGDRPTSEGPADPNAPGNLNLEDLQNLDLNDLANEDLLKNLGQLNRGPTVRLHPPTYQPKQIDLTVALEYINYTRENNPKDHGPKPALAKNPVVTDIATHHAGHTFTGDWLLDTGAPASIISTEQAQSLGLYKNGKPTRPSDFQIPLGGISGKMSTTPGFVIDRLRIKTEKGHQIIYRKVHVLVHDVSFKNDDGQTITLDGVLGTNLLLPTVAGLGQGLGLPSSSAAGPYQRIWIDGPRGKLQLQLATQANDQSKDR